MSSTPATAALRGRIAVPRSRAALVTRRPELLGLMALAAVLDLWALNRNGMANEYYAPRRRRADDGASGTAPRPGARRPRRRYRRFGPRRAARAAHLDRAPAPLPGGELPFGWRIVIVDIASTDATPPIARRLAHELAGVRSVRLEDKGRGRALRAAWSDVRDERWFFATELLVQAQRRGLRIHEVPVDWVDDKDSRVDIVATAWEDLRGIARLAAQTQVARFVAVGIASTIAYAVLYLLLRAGMGPGSANALALAFTAIANTQANRRLTFGVRGRRDLLRHHLQGAVVFFLTLVITSAALDVQQAAAPHAGRLVELAVLLAASICATATRFVALRSWVFARRRGRPTPAQTQLPAD
jgi:putative flippase GtrA